MNDGLLKEAVSRKLSKEANILKGLLTLARKAGTGGRGSATAYAKGLGKVYKHNVAQRGLLKGLFGGITPQAMGAGRRAMRGLPELAYKPVGEASKLFQKSIISRTPGRAASREIAKQFRAGNLTRDEALRLVRRQRGTSKNPYTRLQRSRGVHGAEESAINRGMPTMDPREASMRFIASSRKLQQQAGAARQGLPAAQPNIMREGLLAAGL